MNYLQSTYESCLACCLLILNDKNVEPEIELEILNHSLNYSKFDFVSGHLDYFNSKKKTNFQRVVDNKNFFKYLESIDVEHENVKVERVDISSIDSILKNFGSVVVYLDSYILAKEVHYPHFILITDSNDKSYKVIDPWDGEEKNISKEKIQEGINMLKNHLLFCPQMIYKR